MQAVQQTRTKINSDTLESEPALIQQKSCG